MFKKITIILSWLLVIGGGAYAYTHQEQVSKLVSKFVFESKPLEDLARQAFDTIVSAPAEKIRQLSPIAGSSTLTAEGIITETNKQRALFGLAALTANSKLSAAAKIKAQDMLAKDYFEHNSPTGVGPAGLAKSVGYSYVLIGENLAMGYFKGDFGVVEAWMNSPGHRANILNARYTEIGTYAEKGEYKGQQVWMAVQEFGRPTSACPAVSTSLKAQIDANTSELSAMEAELQQRKEELENYNPKRGSEYNRKVDEYNALVEEYNALVNATKAMVAEYNSQVNAFNACAQG